MRTYVMVIVGGELATFRMMAEKTSDAVRLKPSVDKPCATATTEAVCTA